MVRPPYVKLTTHIQLLHQHIADLNCTKSSFSLHEGTILQQVKIRELLKYVYNALT